MCALPGVGPASPGLSDADILLAGVFGFGGLVGAALAFTLWRCARPSPRPEGQGLTHAVRRWEAVVTKALRFTRRRRRVSLAFGNYRHHQLRKATPKAPRRRVQTPSRRPLREGPAIRSHGANGR